MSLPKYDLPDVVADDVYALLRSIGGSLWSRPGLPGRERVIVTIACTASLGQLSALADYIRLARDTFGLTQEEICEVIMQAGPYGGMPRMIDALGVVKQVFEDEAH